MALQGAYCDLNELCLYTPSDQPIVTRVLVGALMVPNIVLGAMPKTPLTSTY
jgi:hypothetical protein